jgi:hypothetical protein
MQLRSLAGRKSSGRTLVFGELRAERIGTIIEFPRGGHITHRVLRPGQKRAFFINVRVAATIDAAESYWR